MTDNVMKEDKSRHIFEMQADVGRTISNARRLMILDILQQGEMTVNQLADALGMTQSSISQHLSVLRQKGILQSRRDGTVIFYRLTSIKVSQATGIMREVLTEMMSG